MVARRITPPELPSRAMARPRAAGGYSEGMVTGGYSVGMVTGGYSVGMVTGGYSEGMVTGLFSGDGNRVIQWEW